MRRKLVAVLIAHTTAAYLIVSLDLLRLASWAGYGQVFGDIGLALRTWALAPLTEPYVLVELIRYGLEGNNESVIRAAFLLPTYAITFWLVYRRATATKLAISATNPEAGAHSHQVVS